MQKGSPAGAGLVGAISTGATEFLITGELTPLIAIVVGVLCSGLYFGVVRMLSVNRMSNPALVATVSAISICIGIGVGYFFSQPERIIEPLRDVVPQSRVYTIRTAREIIETTTGLTEIAADRMTQPYIGKWLRVKATVREVASLSGSIVVLADLLDHEELSVFLKFYDEQNSAISIETLKRGDIIAVEGKIDSVSRRVISLYESEILVDGMQDFE